MGSGSSSSSPCASTTSRKTAIASSFDWARTRSSWGEITRLIDSTPVPCGKSRETVKRSDLAGHAGYEYCASHSRYFWGFRLYLIRTPDGMPIIWGLANPKIGKREAAETMLRHERHLIRPGQIIIGDKGFAGKDFENFITGKLEAELIRPDPTRPKRRETTVRETRRNPPMGRVCPSGRACRSSC